MKRFKHTTACFDTITQCFEYVVELRKTYYVINKLEIIYSAVVDMYFLDVWYE